MSGVPFFILLLSLSAFARIPAAKEGVINCIKAAESRIGEVGSLIFNHDAAVRLCARAKTLDPITCTQTAPAALADRHAMVTFSDADILELCQGTETQAVIDCAKAAAKLVPAQGSPVKGSADIVFLCQHSKDSSPAECVSDLKAEAQSHIGEPVQNTFDVLSVCSAR